MKTYERDCLFTILLTITTLSFVVLSPSKAVFAAENGSFAEMGIMVVLFVMIGLLSCTAAYMRFKRVAAFKMLKGRFAGFPKKSLFPGTRTAAPTPAELTR